MQKKPLEIPSLPKIEDLVWKKLAFFPYSTHLRNTAYLLQLKEFFVELHNGYIIDRGLSVTYLMNLNRLNADIAEGLLYCILTKECLLNSSRTNKGLGHYLSVAKKKGIISKEIAKKLKELTETRNLLHPILQTELHIKLPFSGTEIDGVTDTMIAEIRDYIKTKWVMGDPVEEENTEHIVDNTECTYCQLRAFHGQQCPACGEFCC